MNLLASSQKSISISIGVFVCLFIMVVVGEPLRLWGAEYINYDDSEYVFQAIEVQERLSSDGLVSWPQIVFNDQHYGKPPLLVNTIAAVLEMLGATDPMVAVRWANMMNMLGLLTAVFVVFWIFLGPYAAVISSFCVFSIPAVVTWSPRVIPEIQITALIVCILTILLVAERRSLSKTLKILLGLSLGLGFLSKATFPLFVVLPFLAWLFGEGGRKESLIRLQELIPSLLIGCALASVWYIPNFHEALAYVKGAVVFVDDPGIGRFERFISWLRVVTIDGVGYIWTFAFVVLGISLVACYFSKKAIASSEATRLALMTSYSALPMLILALTSSAPANTRHPLPSLVLLVLAAFAILFDARSRFIRLRLALSAVFAVIILQAIVLSCLIVSATSSELYFPIQKIAKALNPGVETPQRIDDSLVQRALGAVAEGMGDSSTLVYLAGHSGSLHVPKLNLLAKIEGMAVRFDYATYFSWDSERVQVSLDRLLRQGATILLYEDKNSLKDGAAAYFYQHQSTAVSRLNQEKKLGYRSILIEDNAAHQLQMYKPVSDDVFSALPRQHIGAEFDDGLRIVSLACSQSRVIVRLLAKRKISIDYKLMVHVAADGDSSVLILDQYIQPPLSAWRPGSVRDVFLDVPSGFSGKKLQLKLGFFDETDAKNNWPRLHALDGKDHVVINSACLP